MTKVSLTFQHIPIACTTFNFGQAIKAALEKQGPDGYPPDDMFPFSPPLGYPHFRLELGDAPSSAPHKLHTNHAKPSTQITPAASGSVANHTPTGNPGPGVTIPAADPGQSGDRKRRRNTNSHATRKKKREHESEDGLAQARPEVCDKHVTASQPIHIQVDARNFRAASSGYTAVKVKFEDDKPVTKLEDVVGKTSEMKFRLIKWDGKTVIHIDDLDGRTIVLLAGHPNEWTNVNESASEAMEGARAQCQGSHYRRGDFNTLCYGVSHGGGRTQPMNFSHSSPEMKQLVCQLNTHPTFIRIAQFHNSAFSTFAPDLYKYYVDTLMPLYKGDPTLQRPFERSIYPAVTYNLGPQTICVRHFDSANLAFGWCSVTALGRFDSEKGGHLILWELGLVIEFPAGSTIFLPSAVVSHSNVPIAQDEIRYSFTQYAAGALFQWVESRFQLLKDLKKSLSTAQKKDFENRNKERWSIGLGLFRRSESNELS